ncbi:MAG TPA: hypothetical protein VHV32_18925 [Candidatus Angelobacter sp.]|nr:hypothetical protein [Candidatus Angelobacter sp.]
MAVYRIQAPDGVHKIEGPDNATPEQVMAAFQQLHATLSPNDPTSGHYDPTSDMGTFDRAAAGVGSGLADLYLGGKQLVGAATPEDAAAKRATDAPLMGTTAGKIGSFAGTALPALATLPIPGANTVTGAAAIGGALGALQPTASGESRGLNMGLGAGGGALGQVGANLFGRAIAPIRTALTPEDQRLAQAALQNGIPLDLAQRSGSKPLQIINSVLDNLPITSGREETKRAAQSQAFTRAVMGTTGTASDSAAPDVLAATRARLGNSFNDIYGRNSVNVDNQLVGDSVSALDRADNAAPIVAKTDKITANSSMPGQTYQDIRTQLRTLQGSQDPQVKAAAGQLKSALDDAAARSLSPTDAEALATTRAQYGNLKPIEQAMKSPNGTSGQIPYAAFRQAVSNDPRFVTGGGDLNDLARIGSRFLRDPISNSGTAQRGFYQNLLTQGAGSLALGGTLGTAGYLGGDAKTGAEAAALGILGPVAVQKALSNGLLGKYLVSSPERGLLADYIARLVAPGFVGGAAAALPRPQ